MLFVKFRLNDKNPDELTARDILEYVDYLRRERNNQDSAVNRQVTILKTFYRAMVAMGYLDAKNNPMAHFPKMKAGYKKLPVYLNEDEVRRLLAAPRTDTVMGLRDRALLTLLYGTGIRATECAELTEGNVDLVDMSIRVIGKGGWERCVPLNKEVARAMLQYRQARGFVSHDRPFFYSRIGNGLSRNAIYERVRTYARKARIEKKISPHKLRHTFATHLVKKGVSIVTIRDLLGHHCISSTQVYLHTTAHDMRMAAEKHPVEELIGRIDDLLPNVKLPFQWPPGEKKIMVG